MVLSNFSVEANRFVLLISVELGDYFFADFADVNYFSGFLNLRLGELMQRMLLVY